MAPGWSGPLSPCLWRESQPWSVGIAAASSQPMWAEGCQFLRGEMCPTVTAWGLLSLKALQVDICHKKLKGDGDALWISLCSAKRGVPIPMWDASMSQRKVNISPNLMKVCQYNSRILEFEMICLSSALNVFPSNGPSLMWPNVSGFYLNIKPEVTGCPLPVPDHLLLLSKAKVVWAEATSPSSLFLC